MAFKGNQGSDESMHCRVRDLEQEVLLLSLLGRSLLEVIVENGLCDKAGFRAIMARVDLLDDKEDQGLDVEALAKDLGVGMPAAPDEKKRTGEGDSLRLWLNRRAHELQQRRDAQAAFHQQMSKLETESE